MEPNRPSITPAQITAVLIAGVPAVAKLLAAFGVYAITSAQESALTGALTWLGVLAGVLIVSDAGLRSARNSAHAKTVIAAVIAAPDPAPDDHGYVDRDVSAWTGPPRPGVEMTNTPARVEGEPLDPRLEVPGGSVPPPT